MCRMLLRPGAVSVSMTVCPPEDHRVVKADIQWILTSVMSVMEEVVKLSRAGGI